MVSLPFLKSDMIPTPPFVWGKFRKLKHTQVKKVASLIEKFMLHFLNKKHNFGCLRFNDFNSQLKFNHKYPNFVPY